MKTRARTAQPTPAKSASKRHGSPQGSRSTAHNPEQQPRSVTKKLFGSPFANSSPGHGGDGGRYNTNPANRVGYTAPQQTYPAVASVGNGREQNSVGYHPNVAMLPELTSTPAIGAGASSYSSSRSEPANRRHRLGVNGATKHSTAAAPAYSPRVTRSSAAAPSDAARASRKVGREEDLGDGDTPAAKRTSSSSSALHPLPLMPAGSFAGDHVDNDVEMGTFGEKRKADETDGDANEASLQAAGDKRSRYTTPKFKNSKRAAEESPQRDTVERLQKQVAKLEQQLASSPVTKVPDTDDDDGSSRGATRSSRRRTTA